MMLNKAFYNIENFNNYDNNRQALCDKILKVFWPRHSVYWIDNSSSYVNIAERLEKFKLNNNTKHIIICQAEEDWFYDHDVLDIRKQIRKSSSWSDQSFLITNSLHDYLISKRYIRSHYKPNMLDLFSYKPYYEDEIEKNKKISSIKYHTGYFYAIERPGRTPVFDTLISNKEKCAAIYYLRNKHVDHLDTKRSFNINCPDAPYSHISYDSEWTEKTAFVIAMETFNNLQIDDKISKFAPTFSEKTFKAMHLFRPALVYGGTGSRKALASMGFDTWDWLIDWTYDLPENKDRSFEMYLNELNRLLSIDITEIKSILSKNKKALLHNHRQIFKIINNYDKKD